MLTISGLVKAELSEQSINALVSASEQKILEMLKKEGKGSSEITQYYLNAADQTFSQHQYVVAKILYAKALARKDIDSIVSDKGAIYILLVNASLSSKNKKDAKKYLEEAKLYYNANPKLYRENQRDQLALLKLQISEETSDKILSQDELKIKNSNNYQQAIFNHDIKQHLLAGRYEQAFNLTNEINFKNVDINRRVLADLVYVAANKENPMTENKLYCQNDYEKFPTVREVSYSMKLCEILLTLKSGKKVNGQKLDQLKKLIETRFPENLFMEKVVRQLNKKA